MLSEYFGTTAAVKNQLVFDRKHPYFKQNLVLGLKALIWTLFLNPTLSYKYTPWPKNSLFHLKLPLVNCAPLALIHK